jgi:hypothetical protein
MAVIHIAFEQLHAGSYSIGFSELFNQQLLTKTGGWTIPHMNSCFWD